MFKNIRQFFKKEEPKKEDRGIERVYRDLLRENLNTIAVDVFYHEDPLLALNPSERREYLLYFEKLAREGKLIQRLKYFVNKQANLTLKNSMNGDLDTSGVMKMDGISIIKDDVERLAVMFLKEEADRNRPPLNPKDMLKL